MMKLSNQRTISFQLPMIVRPQTEKHTLGGQLRTGGDRQAQLHLIFCRGMLQRIFLLHLGGPG